MSRRVHAYTGKATVLYQPKIIDSKGQAHTWTFSHDVEPDRLQRAVQNRKEAAALADEISSCYHDELLASAQADDAYRCCVCGSSKVTTLLQHPVPYLQLIQVRLKVHKSKFVWKHSVSQSGQLEPETLGCVPRWIHALPRIHAWDTCLAA